MIARRPQAALVLFAAAALTDFLDGLAARSMNLRSDLGRILDPAGDKLLMTAACVACGLPSLSRPNVLPLALVLVVIGRDLAIALGAFVLLLFKKKISFKPSLWGKISTVLQMGCLSLVLLFNALETKPSGFLNAVYILTLAATAVSGAHYFWTGFVAGLRKRSPRI